MSKAPLTSNILDNISMKTKSIAKIVTRLSLIQHLSNLYNERSGGEALGGGPKKMKLRNNTVLVTLVSTIKLQKNPVKYQNKLLK